MPVVAGRPRRPIPSCVFKPAMVAVKMRVREPGRLSGLLLPAAGEIWVNAVEARERVRASYGDNYDRLAQIKAKYDPDNTFRVNQNIQPKA